MIAGQARAMLPGAMAATIAPIGRTGKEVLPAKAARAAVDTLTKSASSAESAGKRMAG